MSDKLSDSGSSSEDEQPESNIISDKQRKERLSSYTSTSSFTEDEPRSYSQNDSASYYKRHATSTDDDESSDQQNTSAQSNGPSYFNERNSDDEYENFKPPNKRRKMQSESTDSPAPSDNEAPSTYYRHAEQSQPVENKKYDAYSSKSLNMMKKMGYKEDTGLGKLAQGRVDPIEASAQRGRRGLGLKLNDLDAAAVKWDPNIEIIHMPEQVDWLDNIEEESYLSEMNTDLLSAWLKRDVRKFTIDNETKFCDENILKRILESKTVFDKLGAEDMRRSRTKSNPFETIRGNIFVNRAAVKMANMDSMFDFMFTKPVDQQDNSLIGEHDLLYFADVCAGPGGFTEYVLWRNKWEAKGFGFTLKAENDFKLHDFFAGHPESFHPYYGVNNDGDVYDPDNIESLSKLIMTETEVGVHFMMADGGFSVEGQENIQEILSKQLYLAQCLVALSILRTNGHFVVKLFDLFTPFSAGLIYLMSKCFDKICICKPNTSRPANSERYLVCKWKKPNTDVIQRHLFEVNKEMWYNKDSDQDILELVPLHVMQRDENFSNYIYNSNNNIGKNQIVGLIKIAAYCTNNELLESRQSDIRKTCLKLWKLPDKMRAAPVKNPNEQYCADLLSPKWYKEKFLGAMELYLDNANKLSTLIPSIYDYFFVGLDVVENNGKNIRTWFMSKGHYDVVQYNAITGSWTPVSNFALEMSPNTLLYGEIVKELINEGRSQVVMNTLHIIDAIVLGGVDIRQKPLSVRNKICQKFAKALEKPHACNAASQNTPIRCKRLFKLTELDSFFDRLSPRRLKDGLEKLGYDIRTPNGALQFHIPRGLLLMNEVRSDKMTVFSSSQNRLYYYDKQSKEGKFPEQLSEADMYASSKNTFTKRLLWKWDRKEQIFETIDESRREPNILYRKELDAFIRSKLPKQH